MKINQLLAGISNTQINVEVQGLRLNAAQVQTGEVFVALRGGSNHGIDYADEAIKNGCVAILVDSQDYKCSVATIRIDNLKQHLQTLASRCYPNATKVKIIGITGTNGKTSVGHFIAQLLDKVGVKNGLIGTLGISHSSAKSHNTTPDILTLYKTLHQYHADGINTAVLEVSSHALDQDRVAGLNFKQAIFTNLTQDHLDYHHTLERYQHAKQQLFKFASLNSVVVNRDDGHHLDFLNATQCNNQATYGLDDLTKITATEHGFLCQLDDFVFELGLLGEFNLSNILATLSSVEQLGFERENIIPLLPQLLPPTGRMQKIKGMLAWVDYAHTPDAIKNAINTLKTHYPTHKIRVLFGCGGNRDQDKRAKMGNIAAKLADTIVLTNDNPRDEEPQAIINDILSGIDERFAVNITLDRQLAIETATATLNENECLLIAGKGHESTQVFKDEIVPLNDIEIAQNAV